MKHDIDKLKDILGVLCELVELIDAYRNGGSIIKVGIKGYKLLSELRNAAKNIHEARLEYADLDADEKEELNEYVKDKIDIEGPLEPIVELLVQNSVRLFDLYNLIRPLKSA